MASIEPFEDRVLLKKVEAEEKSAGGLFIPDTAKEPSQKAEVIAIGSGRLLDDGSIAPMFAHVGDIVWVGKYAGMDVTIDHEDYTMMRQADLLGRVVE